MACPFFEPEQVCEKPLHPGARLPLIREYEGRCHATGTAVAAPSEMRFDACNRGYGRPGCASFPAGETISCLRYTVRGESAGSLRILCIEERDHTPVRWYEVQFDINSGALAGDHPVVRRAQAEAFGRSYVARGVAR